MSYLNAKLKFQYLGPGAPSFFPLRQGPCGLNSALLGGIPPSVEFPQSTSPLSCSEVVSYTKNIKQHHQMHSNWLKIEWVKNISFFVIHNNTIF